MTRGLQIDIHRHSDTAHADTQRHTHPDKRRRRPIGRRPTPAPLRQGDGSHPGRWWAVLSDRCSPLPPPPGGGGGGGGSDPGWLRGLPESSHGDPTRTRHTATGATGTQYYQSSNIPEAMQQGITSVFYGRTAHHGVCPSIAGR